MPAVIPDPSATGHAVKAAPMIAMPISIHLLGNRLVGVLVSDSVGLLAVELGESDAVGLVGDDEVEDGPYEGGAAVLAGEPADHLGAAFDLAERPFERVCAAPPAAVPGGVAQVDDERVEVVGEAFGGGGVAGTFELVDQRLELLLGVASVDGRIERLPVRLADPSAFALGHLRVEVPGAVHAAALAVRGGPALLDRPGQAGGAVRDNEHRRAEGAGDQVPGERLPVL